MSNNFGFETAADEAASFEASEIQGKTVLMTGCTWGGLGAEAARTIAKHDPKLLILADRKQEALDDTVQKIKNKSLKANFRTLIIDLASMESVKKAAAEVKQYYEPIDVLSTILVSWHLHITLLRMDSKANSVPTTEIKFSSHCQCLQRCYQITPIRFDDPFFESGEAKN